MIKYFRDLLSDRIRIENFRQAIESTVNHNSIVVEIGSALGTYSFFAAKAGAKAIYAIEMNDIFFVGRELAERNNLTDRLKFIHGRSTEIDLPEKADLIIIEDFGPFFYYHNLLEVIRDARERFLKTEVVSYLPESLYTSLLLKAKLGATSLTFLPQIMTNCLVSIGVIPPK